MWDRPSMETNGRAGESILSLSIIIINIIIINIIIIAIIIILMICPIYVNAYGSGKVALEEVGHVFFKQMAAPIMTM